MKITTYSDPRLINKIEDWEEIIKYPHLCVSDTLEQGLSHKFGEEEFDFITTIDKFLNEFYSEWKNNSELSIRQYLELVKLINSSEADKKTKKVLYKNRNEILKSLRTLIECNVEVEDISSDSNSNEYSELLNIYSKVKRTENWNAIDHSMDKGKEGVTLAIRNILKDKVSKKIRHLAEDLHREEDYKADKKSNLDNDKNVYLKLKDISESVFRDLELFSDDYKKKKSIDELITQISKGIEFIESLDNYSVDKIVLHGIHQFTPLICRFINDLESSGIEVIFLIQYDDRFKDIYSTWDKVYKWTETEIKTNNIESDLYCKKVGENYANLVLGRLDKIEESNCECIKFDNMTEFANYVADIYEESNKDVKKGVVYRKQRVLANMKEQFYSANGREVNELLSVYFPEQFGEKHFLSYPIGQFILGLYSMWDFDNNKIVIKDEYLKECLMVNLWFNNESLESPLGLYEKLRVYFLDTEDINLYIERIDKLIKYVEALNSEGHLKDKENYKHLSFFSLSVEDIKKFKKIILDLKELLEKLFLNETDVNIRNHYKELMTILKDKIEFNRSISKQEFELADMLLKKLESYESDMNSPVSEISETLHYYLSKKIEDDSSNWIVRDLPQIDGGVLLADMGKKGKPKRRVYHYAELSDSNMNKDKELSWPLNDERLKINNSNFNVYLTSKKEYSNLIKYILFYGMYYLNTDIKLSYIEHATNENNESLYFPLRMLNIKEEDYVSKELNKIEAALKDEREAKELVNEHEFTIEQIQMMSFCPKRFYYEGLIDSFGTYNNEFLSKMYVKTLFNILVCEKIREKEEINNSVIEKIVDRRIDDGIKLLPSFKRDFQDIKVSIFSSLSKNNNLKKEDKVYDNIRKNYMYRKFTDGEDESKEPVLVSKCDNPSVRRKDIDRIKKYIKQDKIDEEQRTPYESQCKYCKYKEICTFSFQERLD